MDNLCKFNENVECSEKNNCNHCGWNQAFCKQWLVKYQYKQKRKAGGKSDV